MHPGGPICRISILIIFPKSHLQTSLIRICEIELLVHELLERRFILTSPESNSVDSQNPYPHMYKTPNLTFRANKNKMKGAWVSQSRIEETPHPTAAREEGRELE